jgi:hypothetical protein
LAFFKPLAIGLDEFQIIGDDGIRCLGHSFIFPFPLIQSTHDGDPGSLMEIFFSDLGQLIETGYPNPSGLLLRGIEGQIEIGNRLTFAIKIDFWIIAQISRENTLVEHSFVISLGSGLIFVFGDGFPDFLQDFCLEYVQNEVNGQ